MVVVVVADAGQRDGVATGNAVLAHRQGLVGNAVLHLPLTQGRTAGHHHATPYADWGGHGAALA